MRPKINNKAPTFELYSTNLRTFKSSYEKKGLIIYFYPKDNTPGCTLETQDFSKLYKKFKNLNYEVVGISKDNIKSHLGFKRKYKVPFHLLCDEKLITQKKYGVWGKKSFMGKKFMGTIRSTIVISKGKILKTWFNVRVKGHAQEVLDFIKQTK
ncbi:MAG: peroxiredoxin [Candidatus Pelagibacter sp.]|nr:peroxiredoxin [Candidatus Pelagibacter sp.]|tara:strand:- start:174 stop:635 length:462 start_codon:yes stop_codon:yes gene_type:complete